MMVTLSEQLMLLPALYGSTPISVNLSFEGSLEIPKGMLAINPAIYQTE